MKLFFLLIFITGCGLSAGMNGDESRACSVQPSNSVGGIQLSLDNGRTWTACYSMECDSGYVLSDLQTSCIKKDIK